MDRNTKIGMALATAITGATATGCAPTQEKPDDVNVVFAEVTMIGANGASQHITPQPVDGIDACENFAKSIASSGLGVDADCLNKTGEIVDNYYIEPATPDTQ